MVGLPISPDFDSSQCCSLAAGPLSSAEAQRYADLFKFLADPVRLQIISHLAVKGCRPISVGELTDLLDVSQPTISHHLKKMSDAGFLERQRQGRTVIHQIRPELFDQLRTVLQIG